MIVKAEYTTFSCFNFRFCSPCHRDSLKYWNYHHAVFDPHMVNAVGKGPQLLLSQIKHSVDNFFKNFGGHNSFLWGHWYPCYGLLVMSALGFKARVDPSLVCFVSCVQWIPQIHLIKCSFIYFIRFVAPTVNSSNMYKSGGEWKLYTLGPAYNELGY